MSSAKMIEFKTPDGAPPLDGYTVVVPQAAAVEDVLNKRVIVDGNCYLVGAVGHTWAGEKQIVTSLYLRPSRELPPEYFADNRTIGKNLRDANAVLAHRVLGWAKSAGTAGLRLTNSAAGAHLLLTKVDAWSAKFEGIEDPERGYTVCVLHEDNRHYGQAKTFPLAVCDAIVRAYDIKELRDE